MHKKDVFYRVSTLHNATSQTALLTKQTHFICLFVFCLFVPFPREYTVSRGVPESKRWGSPVHGFSGQQKTTQKCVVLRKPWLLCILITINSFHNATIFPALQTHCTTQASVNSRRTPPRHGTSGFFVHGYSTQQKTTQKCVVFCWCRKPDSNRYGCYSEGF